MNIDEISSILGIDLSNNPFAQEVKPEKKNDLPNLLKDFNIKDILNSVDKEEAIEILGDDLIDEQEEIRA